VVQVHLGPRDSPAGQGLSGRYEGASARCDGGCCRRCGALTGTPRSARSVARGDRAGTGGAPRCTTGTPLGDVAQLAEHCLCKAGVRGSIPLVSTTGSLASFVRPAFRRNCLRGAQRVAGSTIWTRSTPPEARGLPNDLDVVHPRRCGRDRRGNRASGRDHCGATAHHQGRHHKRPSPTTLGLDPAGELPAQLSNCRDCNVLARGPCRVELLRGALGGSGAGGDDAHARRANACRSAAPTQPHRCPAGSAQPCPDGPACAFADRGEHGYLVHYPLLRADVAVILLHGLGARGARGARMAGWLSDFTR